MNEEFVSSEDEKFNSEKKLKENERNLKINKPDQVRFDVFFLISFQMILNINLSSVQLEVLIKEILS